MLECPLRLLECTAPILECAPRNRERQLQPQSLHAQKNRSPWGDRFYER